MENGIPNEIRTLRVYRHAIRIDQCISDVSGIDQRHASRISRRLCCRISRRYPDIHKGNTGRAPGASPESFEKTSRKGDEVETTKMRISQEGIGIPWDYRIRTRIQDGSNKDQSHQGMANTHEHSRSPIVPWIHELL